jgi:hypothetical protein
MLCDLTTCCSLESAWLQRLNLKFDLPVSNLAFNIRLRRHLVVDKISRSFFNVMFMKDFKGMSVLRKAEAAAGWAWQKFIATSSNSL